MAHGLPDWYRGVDIAYQALAEIITRPKYGAAQYAMGSVVVDASDETDLVTVSGKGMIYGGVIFLDHTASQKNSIGKMYLDDVAIVSSDFEGLNKHGMAEPLCLPMPLLKYDDTEFIYTLGLSYGYTFEASVKLAYQEVHGSTPTVYYYLYYALV